MRDSPPGAEPAPPPVVSVVMPFLNVAAYLEAAIASVRAQTYPHWELLLADDGASDGSRAIAQRAAAADPGRIRWLAPPVGGAGQGASAARNRALAVATGHYVAFLDGDDRWHPAKLAEQVALLEGTPAADVLVGSTEYWYGWTGRPEDAARDVVVPIGVPHGTIVPGLTLLAGMLEGTFEAPCTCSLIARHEAVRRSGGFEEAFTRVYTDQAFYARLFLEASVLVVDTCWDQYRRHAESSVSVSARSGELRAARLRWLVWLRAHLAAHGVRDPAMRRTIDRTIGQLRHPRLAAARARLRGGLHRARGAAGAVLAAVRRAAGGADRG